MCPMNEYNIFILGCYNVFVSSTYINVIMALFRYF